MKLIKKGKARSHSKASERYIDVLFDYKPRSSQKFLSISTSIPIEYRRTSTFIEDDEVDEYILKIYKEIHPENWDKWKEEQRDFWNLKKNAKVTKSFFDRLAKNFKWCCSSCELPSNPNWARRIQDIKELGYTLATDTKKNCPVCKKNTSQIILLPIRRGGMTGYETWSKTLRKRIISLLDGYDAYEAKKGSKEMLLPDHKFPETRWNSETKRDNLESLEDYEIIRDFQLLSNQRNQQKREVCRKCYQSNERGIVYGIPFYYKGQKKWDSQIPKRGKEAEAGCVGCGWYDLEKWRQELKKVFS